MKPVVHTPLLVLLVTGLVFVVFLLLPVYELWSEAKLANEELAFKLAKSRSVLANKETIEQSFTEVTTLMQSSNYFCKGETEQLASADLQMTVKNITTASGAELSSVQVMQGKNEEGFIKVPIRVNLIGTNENLRSILYAFEANIPFIFLQSLDLVPIRNGRPGVKGADVEKINMTLEPYCYIRAG
jgi:general secretion pathway protein M